MNKENSTPNLGAWCAQYQDKTGLKIHPSSVPVELVLEDVLSSSESLRKYCANLLAIYNDANERLTALEQRITELKKQANELDVKFVNSIEEVVPKKKKVKKNEI